MAPTKAPKAAHRVSDGDLREAFSFHGLNDSIAKSSDLLFQLIICADRPGMFRAWLGSRLVGTWREPLFATARLLLAEGADPDALLSMRWRDSRIESMRGRVGVLAGLAVKDDGTPSIRR